MYKGANFDATEFEFIEGDLPTRLTSPNPKLHALIFRFSEALKDNPGKWAVYPIPLKPSTSSTTATNIRRHRTTAGVSSHLKQYLSKGFDARSIQGVLYVRYIGDESETGDGD